MEQQGIKYSVDIVLCIDATGSMSPIIDEVKSGALRFYEDLNKQMEEKSKSIDTLRLRVIAFRDYYVEGEEPLRQSAFYTLPQQKDEFSAFVRGIEADGGGDEPENGLEALALAIKSEWAKTGDKRRHVIVMWTDASAHPLEKNSGIKPPTYPQGLPQNFDELTDMWEGQSYINRSSKRLVIYSPDSYAWTDIANNWENVVHYPSKAGKGLSEVDYQEILSAIANSV